MNDSAQDRAAQLLVSGGALLGLSLAEARLIVGYMHPQLVNAGEVLIREGEASDNGFMALVVDGEVTVENASASDESVVVTVLGPGSLIGEMGPCRCPPLAPSTARSPSPGVSRSAACCTSSASRTCRSSSSCAVTPRHASF